MNASTTLRLLIKVCTITWMLLLNCVAPEVLAVSGGQWRLPRWSSKAGHKGIFPLLLKLIAAILYLRRIQEQRQGIGQSSKVGIKLSFLPFQVSARQKAACEW